MRLPRLVFQAALLLALAFPLYAQDATGLRPPTAEEAAWDAANLVHLDHVSLNDIGQARVAQAMQDGLMPPSVQGEGPLVGLPPAVDNSTLKYFPPVRSQGSIGSCAAFSSTYYTMTYMVARARDWDVKNNSDNSNKFSPKWTYNMINGGSDSGSWITGAYNVAQKHGVATWQQFPYDSNYRAWSLDPAVWRSAINYRMGASGTVGQLGTDTGLANLKTMLANGYVLNYATYINSWQYTTVKDDPATTADNAQVGKKACHWVNGTNGGHAMTVVGYNDDLWIDVNGNGTLDAGEKGAVRVVNSWGTGWGNGGFCWLAYDALKSTSAVSGGPSTGRQMAWWSATAYWIDARASYTPSLIGEFTINTAKRGRMAITPGVSTTSVTTPSKTWTAGAINYQGGDYGFGGTTTAVEATFVFDYTDLVNQVSNGSRWYATLKGGVADAPASITRFKLTRLSGNISAEWTGLKETTGGTEHVYVDMAYTEPQPDLQVARAGGGLVGDNAYNADGAGQTASSFLAAGTPEVFRVMVGNDWSSPDTVRLTGPGDAAGWTVRYFDAPTGGSDITAAVTGSGWDVALHAGATREVRVEVTGDASLAAGDARSLLIAAESTSLATRKDAVIITATMGSQADLLVKVSTGASFVGDGVFNATGVGQSAHASVPASTTATYLVELQNEWVSADTFSLTGPAGGAGWTVRYFDAPTAGTDITAAVTGASKSLTLAPGATRQVRIEVTPDATVAGYAQQPVLLTATSQASDTVDAVLAITTAQPLAKVDLEISQDGGTTYIGTDVYSTDGSTEVAAQTVEGGDTAVYPMRFTDKSAGRPGVGSQTYISVTSLRSFPAGWTVRFFDGKGSNITAQVTGSGWTGWALSTGPAALRVEVKPGNAVPANAQLVVPITISALGEGSGGLTNTVCDVVQAVTTCSGGPQPDLVTVTATGTPEGDGVYDDGTTQTVAAMTAENSAAVYRLKVQNDWIGTDTITITGSALAAGWTARYYDDAGNDITASVAGGWAVKLDAGEERSFRVAVTPDTVVATGAAQTLTVLATSQVDNTKTDAARLTTTNGGPRQPDLEIGGPTGALLGAGTFNGTGTGQTVSQTGVAGVTLVYRLRVRNDAGFDDTLTVSGPGSGGGWTVRYFDAHAGGNEITADITGVGWTLPLLAQGAQDFRVEISHDGTPDGGSTLNVPITAAVGTPPTVDVAVASATASSAYGLDALLRVAGGADVGAGVRNTDAAGQVVSRTVAAGGTVTYVATIRNEGNRAQQVRVTRPAVPAGWTLHAYDSESGGTEITGALATGWTTTIARNGTQAVRLEVTAGVTLAGGVPFPLLLTAEVVGQDLADAVKALTSVTVVRRPDLAIRASGDVAMLGDDAYNETGSGQTAAQPSGRAKVAVSYIVAVQNDGNAADDIRLAGTTGGAGWTVRYFDAATGGTEITSTVVAGTYTVSGLAAGATRTLRVEVTPDTTVPAGIVQEFTLTARSVSAPTALDVVKGRTLRQTVPAVDLVLRNPQSLTTLIGNDVRSADGSGQALALQTRLGAVASFRLVVQNDGEVADTLVIRGEAAGPGWVARYYDSPVGGYDITSLVTGPDGWVLANRSPKSYRDFRVELSPTSASALGTSRTVKVWAHSQATPDVKDVAALTASWPTLSAVTLAAAPGASSILGAPLTFTATPSGGNQVDYQFRYYYRDAPTGWVTIRTFGAGNTVTWTPPQVGLYYVIVYAMERGSADKYAISHRISIQVTAKPELRLTATPGTGTATANTAVTLSTTANVTGDYEYAYRIGYVSGGTTTWSTLRGYQTSPLCTWTPAAAGTYYLDVQVRTVGTRIHVGSKRIAYVVQ